MQTVDPKHRYFRYDDVLLRTDAEGGVECWALDRWVDISNNKAHTFDEAHEVTYEEAEAWKLERADYLARLNGYSQWFGRVQRVPAPLAEAACSHLNWRVSDDEEFSQEVEQLTKRYNKRRWVDRVTLGGSLFLLGFVLGQLWLGWPR